MVVPQFYNGHSNCSTRWRFVIPPELQLNLGEDTTTADRVGISSPNNLEASTHDEEHQRPQRSSAVRAQERIKQCLIDLQHDVEGVLLTTRRLLQWSTRWGGGCAELCHCQSIIITLNNVSTYHRYHTNIRTYHHCHAMCIISHIYPYLYMLASELTRIEERLAITDFRALNVAREKESDRSASGSYRDMTARPVRACRLHI